jgi:hypothetical protein
MELAPALNTCVLRRLLRLHRAINPPPFLIRSTERTGTKLKVKIQKAKIKK